MYTVKLVLTPADVPVRACVSVQMASLCSVFYQIYRDL